MGAKPKAGLRDKPMPAFVGSSAGKSTADPNWKGAKYSSWGTHHHWGICRIYQEGRVEVIATAAESGYLGLAFQARETAQAAHNASTAVVVMRISALKHLDAALTKKPK